MAAEPQRSRCLYEILGVPRDSSQDDIRSAYRKLALKLHPDKIAASGQNPNSGDATARFQELLHAYEVLSDPKERQFYDSHRSQILFSDPNSSNPRSSSSVFDLDLFSFFSNSAFSGFGDTGKGFFKVYGDVFGKIYSQELYFVKELGFDRDSVKPPPLIGNLESDYSQVTAFYGYWLGFCTVLDFAWVDEFDVLLGPNRRSRRAMEEENKKKRKKARKEYNDLVRDLAAFAKKRDKRVRDMQMKKTREEEKRKEEEKVRRKEEERKKAERARAYEEPEWARIDEEEEEKAFGDMHGGDDVEDEEKKKTEFYCVVCNKKFKSDKQWKNHEQSKKHKEKVAELRVSFHEEEEEEVVEEEEEVVDDNSGEVGEGENSSVVDELCQGVKDDMGFEERSSMGNGDGGTVREEPSGRKKDGLEFEEEGIESEETEESDKGLELDEEASILEAMVSGRKNKKIDHFVKADSPSNESVSHPIDDEQSSMGHDRRKGRRRRAARRGNDDADGDGGDETVSEQTSGRREEDSEIQNGEGNFEKLNEGASCSFEGATSKGKGDQAVGKNQKHKKQPLDGKKPAQKETHVSKSSSKGRKQKGSTKAPSNDCDTCGESFDTRNKLFAHLGATGHASLKSR